MCAMSAEERALMSSKGRASFCKRYNLERNAIDLLDLLKKEIQLQNVLADRRGAF